MTIVIYDGILIIRKNTVFACGINKEKEYEKKGAPKIVGVS